MKKTNKLSVLILTIITCLFSSCATIKTDTAQTDIIKETTEITTATSSEVTTTASNPIVETIIMTPKSTNDVAKTNFDNEAVLLEKDVIKNYTTDRCSYFYNFNTILTTGISKYGCIVPIETDLYGIKTEIISDTILNVSVYNNSEKNVHVTNSYIENYSDTNDRKYFEDQFEINEITVIDTKNLNATSNESTMYKIVVIFDTNETVCTYFITNNNETKLCAKANDVYTDNEIQKIKAHRDAITQKITNDTIIQSEQIAVENTIYYPYWHFNQPEKYRCDTDKWVEITKTIVTDDMSNELKVWKFYNWLAENIAYDYYGANSYTNESGQGLSRSALENNYSGKNSVYNLRCGVCVDYANIFAIFCRSYNIPTIVISDIAHAWNAVYLNGRWIEIDCARVPMYYVETENASMRGKFYETDLRNLRKYDFDLTKSNDYIDHITNIDRINRYLYTDKEFVR